MVIGDTTLSIDIATIPSASIACDDPSLGLKVQNMFQIR